MMKVGILGGSFDPFHKGHFGVAKYTKAELNLDLVLLMCSKCSPFKNGITSTSFTDRLNMVKLYNEDGIKATAFEQIRFPQQDIVYTVECLKKYKSLHPDHIVYYIMGQASFNKIEFYRDYEWLLDKNNVYLVVYGRPNYEQSENKYENVIFLYDTPMNDISSTEIREILKKEDYNNKRLNDCLIEEQIKYIKENGLYTNN